MNIFVAKLSYDTTSETLEETFAAFGEVESAKVIFDRDTGRSRGFGFVEMPNDDEAYAAIEELNESELDGRTIIVKKARPKGDGGGRNNRGGGYNRGGGGGYNRGGGGGYNRGGGGYNRGGRNSGGGGYKKKDDYDWYNS